MGLSSALITKRCKKLTVFMQVSSVHHDCSFPEVCRLMNNDVPLINQKYFCQLYTSSVNWIRFMPIFLSCILPSLSSLNRESSIPAISGMNRLENACKNDWSDHIHCQSNPIVHILDGYMYNKLGFTLSFI